MRSVVGSVYTRSGPRYRVPLQRVLAQPPGMGAQDTRIDGNKLERVFDIRVGTATEVHIEGVTITGGDLFESGGGIRINDSGMVTIADSIITANVAGGGGGGILKTAGTFDIMRVIVNKINR